MPNSKLRASWMLTSPLTHILVQPQLLPPCSSLCPGRVQEAEAARTAAVGVGRMEPSRDAPGFGPGIPTPMLPSTEVFLLVWGIWERADVRKPWSSPGTGKTLTMAARESEAETLRAWAAAARLLGNFRFQSCLWSVRVRPTVTCCL